MPVPLFRALAPVSADKKRGPCVPQLPLHLPNRLALNKAFPVASPPAGAALRPLAVGADPSALRHPLHVHLLRKTLRHPRKTRPDSPPITFPRGRPLLSRSASPSAGPSQRSRCSRFFPASARPRIELYRFSESLAALRSSRLSLNVPSLTNLPGISCNLPNTDFHRVFNHLTPPTSRPLFDRFLQQDGHSQNCPFAPPACSTISG